MPTPTVTLQSCYKMKSFLVNLIFILGFTTTLRGGEIKVLLNPENQNVSDALVVVFPKKVKVKKGQTTLEYKVLNRSSEDSFIGGTGTLSLQIKYYVGSSKGRHMATVAVPLEIQAAESDQGK